MKLIIFLFQQFYITVSKLWLSGNGNHILYHFESSSISWVFSDLLLIVEIFFLVLKTWWKVMKFGYVFAKRLRTTLKMFLNNRSEQFANMTQILFDKRSFQKLEKYLNKNSHAFGKIEKNFLVKNIFVIFFFYHWDSNQPNTTYGIPS